uniref:Metalloendopeptidase n=1 Tax=Anisakis simplex TaxID=6269 RepID=A0A0M3J6D7_ANISI
LADECIRYSTIIHELMHVIGFIHEHQRADRDAYVKIMWQNVIPGAESDFDKLPTEGLSYYGEEYDYFSIMHYESNEGSRNGLNTIEANVEFYTKLMGKGNQFSAADLHRINRAYRCSSTYNLH